MPDGRETVLLAIVFFLPGYLVFKAKESVAEAKTVSKFELSVQSVAYSVVILSTYLLIPPLRRLVNLGALFGGGTLEVVVSIEFLYAGLAVLGITGIAAVVAALWKYNACYHRLLHRLGFRRLNKYITTWEEFTDIAFKRWVCIRLENGYSYIGVIRSVTHHPYEKEIILSSAKAKDGTDYPIQVYGENNDHITPVTPAEYMLLNMSSVRWIAIL